MKTAGVFIHLMKAFDTIDHIILIKKLSHYDVRGTGLNWIENYLDHREPICNVQRNQI